MWAETLAVLRRALLELRSEQQPLEAENEDDDKEGYDWKIGRTGNYETVYSSSRKIAFTVVRGNKYAGIDGLTDPQPARDRGPQTKRRIYRNNSNYQLPFDIFQENSKNAVPVDESCTTWFILFRITKDKIFIEVSLPTEIDDDGKVSGWVKRILVPPLPTSGTIVPTDPDEDDGDDYGDMVSRP